MDEQAIGAVDWARVQDAYGSAEAVPGLLARAAEDPSDSGVWIDLWSRLCHQGTVYEASFLAIPTLAAIARSAPATAYSPPLNLLAAIAGSTDVSGTPDTRERYADALASCLPAAETYAAAAEDDRDFCYALSVVAGLRGEQTWHQVLTWVAEAGVPVTCPGCGEDLCLILDGYPPHVTLSWDDTSGGPNLVPAGPDAIVGFAAHMVDAATQHSRHQVARRLLATLGDAWCPVCGLGFSSREALGLGDGAQMPSEVWTAGYVFTEPLRDLREAVGEAATLREELLREIGAGHVLHGVELHVIARATPQDDVIVQAADGRVALVHLTWSGHPDTPPWPTTELVTSPEHLENLIESRY